MVAGDPKPKGEEEVLLFGRGEAKQVGPGDGDAARAQGLRGRTCGEPADEGGGDAASAPAETPHMSRNAMRKRKRVRSRGVDGPTHDLLVCFMPFCAF